MPPSEFPDIGPVSSHLGALLPTLAAMPRIPFPPEEAVKECGEALERARAALGPDEALEVTVAADGFAVRSICARGPLLELRGLTVDGRQATRLVHLHQLDLQIVVVPASDQNCRAFREIGFHVQPNVAAKATTGA